MIIKQRKQHAHFRTGRKIVILLLTLNKSQDKTSHIHVSRLLCGAAHTTYGI